MSRMKEIRQAKGVSQVQVARAIKVSRQSYNFYESGKRDPNTETLKLIADYFGVTVDYLLGNDIPAPLPQEVAQAAELRKRLNDLFGKMSPEQQQLLISLAENMKR